MKIDPEAKKTQEALDRHSLREALNQAIAAAVPSVYADYGRIVEGAGKFMDFLSGKKAKPSPKKRNAQR